MAKAWTELSVSHALARQTFKDKLIVVPNCTWTGHECDLLVVNADLRIIDVEVKISRADLKVDAKKDKWWHRDNWSYGKPMPPRVARDWPPRVWKHYYALPAEIWDDALFDFLPGPMSGVIVVREQRSTVTPVVAEVIRRATPNPAATPISPASAIAIARLASLRMWDAFKSSANAPGSQVDAGDHQTVTSDR